MSDFFLKLTKAIHSIKCSNCLICHWLKLKRTFTVIDRRLNLIKFKILMLVKSVFNQNIADKVDGLGKIINRTIEESALY